MTTTTHSMSTWLIRLAAIYFAVGATLGFYMAATHDHTARPVHAHINLLGWVSLAVAGILYRLLPRLADSWPAKLFFTLYNLGLPVMLSSLYVLLTGHPGAEPVVAAASTVVLVGIFCFVVSLLRMQAQD